jgi:CBS domain containing-hemolysin-like protein
MSPTIAGLLTIGLLAGNAFFVAAEFALVAARRHRLAPAAEAGSRAARAAIHGTSHLPLMLAGAQFGITMCSLGLGIVTEPAFEAVLAAPLHTIGIPEAGAAVIALICALAVVTFLHMVVGEMAPKSWAIAHPERSAMLIARPFGAFTAATRPVLAALNGVTNALLRLAGVHPREEIETSADPARLAGMLGESRRLGLINRSEHDLLDRAIAVRENTIAGLTVPVQEVTAVPATATPADIRRAAAASGRTRLPVVDEAGVPIGLTHLRDAIVAGAAQVTAAQLLHPMPRLAPDTTILDAVTRLRDARAQLAMVTDGAYLGIVSLDDLLAQLLAANPH